LTHLELEQYVRSLAARVAELEKKTACLDHPFFKPKEKAESPVEPPKDSRKMCPHCGVKPNHFFHVKTCANKKKNNGEKETPS
jgi:hypothetical protein